MTRSSSRIAIGTVAIVAVVAILLFMGPVFDLDGQNIAGEAYRTGLKSTICEDPDGTDVHIKTMVAYGNKKLWDRCGSSPDIIVESFCDRNGRATQTNMACPTHEVCQDGACVPETLTRPGRVARTTCFDPDDGNLYIRTEVTTDTHRVLDQCMSTKIIQEGVCGINGEPSYALAACPDGFVCRGGACKKLYGKE